MNKNNHQFCATIALVGAPNAGKSTLTNALLGQKISIVSPKVQTTRNTIKAIITEDQTQLVILDTPGVFLPRSDKILERIIVKSAWQGIRDADFICFLIDSSVGLTPENLRIINQLKEENIQIIVVLNKIDLIKKANLLAIIKALDDIDLKDILMISAENKEGVEDLKHFLCSKAKPQSWIYDDSYITDAPMRFTASEVTREKLFLKLNQELPYSLTVKTDSYEVLGNGEVKIHQTIFILKESQKKIILGKNGNLIKEIGSLARHELSQMIGSDVHLYLFIKVKKDWMQDVESYESLDLNRLPGNINSKK
jgi:GTP-binding protein Era